MTPAARAVLSLANGKQRPLFVISEAFKHADRVLALPPARAHIERPQSRGVLVKRFALPLDLCKPQNRTRHGQAWALGKLKKDIAACLRLQAQQRREPLPGRPQVLCLRLSSVEPDKYADWAKHAIDQLCPQGLNFLRDDRPQDAEIHQWWEPAPKGAGCVVIEVRA